VSTAPVVLAHRGAFGRLPAACDGLGVRRAILVACDSVRASAAGARQLLGPRCVGWFSHPVPHVPAREANLAVASAQEIHADGVISVGGGSAVGYGKIIALALRLPLIAVPTSYAGSEMTDRYAVTTDRGKEAGTSERALPRLVIHDPEITLDMPLGLTRSSGMTAVGHCLEALERCRDDRRAAAALRILWSTLPELLRRPRDAHLRDQALYAAGLAGSVQQENGSGLLSLLAENLGGRYRVDHGALVGCLAPLVIGHHQQALDEFVRRLGLPTTLAELGVDRHVAEAVAALAGDSGQRNTVTDDDVRSVLMSA